MLHNIIQASLKFRHLVLAIAGFLLVFGVIQIRNMPVDVFPEFAPPFVEIHTEALGLSAEEVEALITVTLEADLLNGVSWLKSIHSESRMGLSRIILTFEPGTDMMAARQMVQERLIQAHALPNVSKPPTMLQPLSATSRVMMVGLSSEELSLIEMSVLARWTIRPRLLGVPGVANVSIWGQRKRQLQVRVDPVRLKAHDVTLQDVIETTGNALWVSPLTFLNASTPGTGGWVETPNQRLNIRHVLPISSPQELAQVTFKHATGLSLGDVADVVENHQPLIGDALIDEAPGLLLVVEKFPGENTLALTKRLDEAINVLRPGLSGIDIDTQIFRPADYLETSLGNLGRLLLIGAALAALVLLVFHGQGLPALISLISIPLSMIVAIVILHLSGATLNVMVLAGLLAALVVVIDDAVVDVATFRQRLSLAPQKGDALSKHELVLKIALQVRRPLSYAVIVMLLTVAPILFMEGVLGAFLAPFAWAYALAVLAAMLVASSVTIVLGLTLLKRTTAKRNAPALKWIQAAYQRAMARLMRSAAPAYGIAVACLIAAVAVVPFLGQEVLPTLKESDLVVRWRIPSGSSHPEAVRLAGEATRELLALPAVRDVTAQLGRAVLGDDAVDVDEGQLWINIDTSAEYAGTVVGIQALLEEYPGLFSEVQPYLKERIREVLSGSSDPLVVRLYGFDNGILRQKADEIRRTLGGIEGIDQIHIKSQVEQPQVQIKVNMEMANNYGLKPGDVRRAAATLLSGIEVGSLFEEQKVFDVVVWGVPNLLNSLTSVRDLFIDTPSGGQVRLAQLADVSIEPVVNVIQREGVARHIDISATVRGRDLGAVTQDVDQAIKQMVLPLEYHAEILGEYAELQSIQQNVWAFVLAAAIGIYLMLQAAFGSWRLATLVFVTLPIGLTGGLPAAFAANATVSLGSMLGLLALVAICARNSMLFISECQRLETQHVNANSFEIAQRASEARFGALMMTAMATGLGLLPIVLAGNIAGLEVLRPMTVVMLGGLISTTLLALFVLPSLYARHKGAGFKQLGREEHAAS